MQAPLYIANGRVVCGRETRQTGLLVRDGRIAAFPDRAPEGARVLDAAGGWVLPGFVDVHTHGGDGVDFNDTTEEGYRHVSRFFAMHGCTGFLPTVMTDTKARMLRGLRLAGQMAAQTLPGAQVLGIHLEGPFLAKEYKGAMPEELLREPEIALFEELQHASGGHIRVVTLAPELPGVETFIRALAGRGVRVSLGHSGASYEQAQTALRAGATASTHTGNAMVLPHQHRPGLCGAVLEGDAYCEMIADGRHLHPAMVRLLVKTKGMERLLAVTDSMMAAGKPDGTYALGPNKIVVVQGDALLKDGRTRAGSTLTMDEAFQNIRTFTGLAPQEVACMTATNQADYLGILSVGGLETGKRADIALLDKAYRPAATIVGGQIVWQEDCGGGTA